MGIRIIRPVALEQRPAAVLFDLDNTLYDYEPAHTRAMTAVREKAARALNTSKSTFDTAFDEARRAVKQRLGHTAAAHSRLLYFQRAVELMGYRTQVLLALDLEQTYWRTLMAAAQLLPGVEQVLVELRAAGIPLVIVTDLTAQIQFRKLIHFGIEHYFDAVVTSEEAGREKVDLAPFQIALEKLALDSQARVWMVGDSASDIVRGKQAMNCCAFQKNATMSHGSVFEETDVLFDSFTDLLRELQKLPLGSPSG